MDQWEVRLLGGFQIQRGEQVIRGFRTRTVDSLFAYLALHPRTEIRRDTLIDLGWPDSGHLQGSQSLRTALHNLRTLLGSDCLRVDRQRVGLVPERFVVDAVQFRATRDLSLYRGRLLEDFADPWMLPIAQELEDLYCQEVMAEMEKSPPEAAVRIADEALKIHPSLIAIRAKLRELNLEESTAHPRASPFILTSFVGRNQEIKELTELIKSNRLVTLTGLGGSGKTRLASELWRRHLPQAWFIPLADVTASDQIGDVIRRRLRLPATPNRSGLEQVVSCLREATGLLVLDNFEQILEGVWVVEELLQECPDLAILVTSRVSLGLAEGVDYPVGPLSLSPEKDGQPSDSAALFEERAKASVPDFALSPSNIDSVSELCERLDGFPLSLEMAAAKARLFSPEEMLTQLKDRFDFLTHPAQRSSNRQGSLLTALDWSFDRLGKPEQEVLCRLSIFDGGFTLDAAREVCGATPNGSEVWSLLSSAWIERSEHEGRTRFRMLESVRDYCRSLLRPTGVKTLKEAHARYFHKLAQNCFDFAFTPHEPTHFRQVRDEAANLDAAWQWLSQHDAEGMLGLATYLSWFWTLSGSSQIGERRVKEALTRASVENRPLLTAAVHACGTSLVYQGKSAEADDWYRRANKIALETLDNLYIGMSSFQIGRAQSELGNYGEARDYVESGIARILNEPNINWHSTGYTIRTLVANQSGEVETALNAGKIAVSTGRDGGYVWGIASALNELAMACHLSGDLEGAVRYQLESIALKEESQTTPSLALSYCDLAASYLAMDELDQSLQALKEWSNLVKQVEMYEAFPRAYGVAAELFAHKSCLELAAASLDKMARAVNGRPMTYSEKVGFDRARSKVKVLESPGSDPSGELLVALESL